METREPIVQDRIAAEGVPRRLRRHTSELVRLATPIVASRAGFLTIIMADTVMTGHFSAAELAYLAIGLGIFMPMMLISLGMIMGTTVLTANAVGAGRLTDCGPVWRRSLQYSLMLGVIAVFIGGSGETLLTWSGQTAHIAEEGGHVVSIISLGLPGQLLYLSSIYFMEALGRPVAGMVIMFIANILNIVLNYVLIYGMGDIPPLGAAGAATATSITRWFMGLSMIVVVWTMRDHAVYAIREKLAGGLRAWAEQRRLGYAIGITVGVESLAFAAMNVFAGWLGEIPLAAYGLTFNLMSLCFMAAIGIGSATAVRVGIAYGRGDISDAALAGWTGLGVCTLVMLMAGLILTFFRDSLAAMYTDDPALLAASVVTIAVLRYSIVPDGGQAMMAGALRGYRDVWVPSIIQTVSFFGVMVPVGYVAAFTYETGILGLFYGVIAGCIVSLTWLSLRFQQLNRRYQRHNPKA